MTFKKGDFTRITFDREILSKKIIWVSTKGEDNPGWWAEDVGLTRKQFTTLGDLEGTIVRIESVEREIVRDEETGLKFRYPFYYQVKISLLELLAEQAE